MDTKINYALVGFFVIVLSVAMIICFFWLSTSQRNKIYHPYITFATSGVNGLNVDTPVQYNGVRVGLVKKIILDPQDPQLVEILMQIEEGTPVLESTTATLIPQGITGLVYVGLESSSPTAPVLKAKPGEKYPVIAYRKPLLSQLADILPKLADDLQDIATSFKNTFSDQNVKNFTKVLNNIQQVTNMLNQQSNSIRDFLNNSAKASQHFGKVVDDISSGANNINQQLLPSMQELLDRLNDTTMNLQQFSSDLDKNPAVLLRGKQPPPPGPGEK